MNHQVIPLGVTETITNGTITDQEVLLLSAETELTVTDLVYQYPKTPANAGAVDAFTMAAGRHLFYVKSITFTGTATVIYTKP